MIESWKRYLEKRNEALAPERAENQMAINPSDCPKRKPALKDNRNAPGRL